MEEGKLTTGPFKIDVPAKKSLALILRGESYRNGRQHSRETGNTPESIHDQVQASISHMENIVKPFEERGYEVEIFIQTREARPELTTMLKKLYGEHLKKIILVTGNMGPCYNKRTWNAETKKFEYPAGYTPVCADSGMVASWKQHLMNLADHLQEKPRGFSHVFSIRCD